jgi:hypothetical protein
MRAEMCGEVVAARRRPQRVKEASRSGGAEHRCRLRQKFGIDLAIAHWAMRPAATMIDPAVPCRAVRQSNDAVGLVGEELAVGEKRDPLSHVAHGAIGNTVLAALVDAGAAPHQRGGGPMRKASQRL